MKMLYSSNAVHNAVKQIMKPRQDRTGRRVALVAYIGSDALAYLPSPKNLHLICSPQPGSTDPDSIRALLKTGARVQFSDRLHMKIYWSYHGAVVTSANLSNNALGTNGQKEAGVLLNSRDIDIERLLRYAEPYDVTEKIMKALDRGRTKVRTKNGAIAGHNRIKRFTDWFTDCYRTCWKLGWWDEGGIHTAANAMRQSSLSYGVRDPYDWLNVKEREARPGEWLLAFEITDKGIAELEWMYVDFVIKVHPTEKPVYQRRYPYQAVQVHKPNRYPSPPFNHRDPRFIDAFNKAAIRYGLQKIKDQSSTRPPPKLLKLTYSIYMGEDRGSV